MSSRLTSMASWYKRASRNLRVDDPSLLRGMPLAHGLRSFSKVLSQRPCTAEYYALSAPVGQINTFVSHNWCTPRYRKFLVLIFHYNIWAAFAASFMAAACILCLTAMELLPHAVVATSFARGGAEYSRGIFCLPVGLIVFLAALLGVHELDGILVPWRRHTLFLDKTCVAQVDEELKRKGIQCLAAFISRSSHILVMWTDIYMQKLWTVYEVATWLLLHPGRKMIVRPVAVPVVLLSGVLCTAIYEASIFAVQLTHVSTTLPPIFGVSVTVGMVLPTVIVLALLLARLAADRDKIASHVARFSLADAQCTNEEDRLIVQSNIVGFMKLARMSDPEDEEEQVFEAFEGLVRRDVPKLMKASFGRIGMPYNWVICPLLPRVLATFDIVAGLLLDRCPFREVLLRCIFHVALVLLCAPLCIAVMVLLTSLPRLRSVPACCGVGVLAAALLLSCFRLLEALTEEAVHSDSYLACLVALYGLLAVTTILTYWPPTASTPRPQIVL